MADPTTGRENPDTFAHTPITLGSDREIRIRLSAWGLSLAGNVPLQALLVQSVAAS
jgi:hypothetical protein